MKFIFILLLISPSFLFAQPPVNDLPCGAINIPVVTASSCIPTTIYTWANATFSTGNTSNPQCGNFGNTSKDVWFKFTPTTNNCAILFDKAFTISHDLAAAVYDAESCSFFYSFTQCDDDSGPDNYPQFTFNDFIPGATYFLRVWQYNPLIDSGSAKICIVSEPNGGSTSKVGINTNFPSANFDINGLVKIRGGQPALNKVLTSDAYGNATWKIIPQPTKIAFGSYQIPGAGQTIPAYTYTKVLFGEPEEMGVTNFSSGVFTAPETALYHFETMITFTTNVSANVEVRIVIKNGTGTILRNYSIRENNLPSGVDKTLPVSATVSLLAGQTAEVQFYHTIGGGFAISYAGSLGIDRKTRFAGYKVF